MEPLTPGWLRADVLNFGTRSIRVSDYIIEKIKSLQCALRINLKSQSVISVTRMNPHVPFFVSTVHLSGPRLDFQTPSHIPEYNKISFVFIVAVVNNKQVKIIFSVFV